MFDQALAGRARSPPTTRPIYIADAALYLKATKPELGIKDPYALDATQLDGGGRPAEGAEGRTSASTGRTTSRRSRRSRTGSSTVGTTWQVIANLAQAEKAQGRGRCCPRRARPAGRTPGWSAPRAAQDLRLQVGSTTSCRRRPTPPIAEYFGEAPANKKACAETADPNHCTTFHAEDEDYFSKVRYWNTPIYACLDGRTDVKCTDYAEWTKAWTEIRNS